MDAAHCAQLRASSGSESVAFETSGALWLGRAIWGEGRQRVALMVLLSAIQNTAITRQLPTMQQWQLEASIRHTHTQHAHKYFVPSY